jgi:replicative DNA helicase
MGATLTDKADKSLSGLSLLQPPANIQAEQALLGAIFANNRAFHHVAGFLRPDHFADPVHGRIYKECAKIILRNGIADAVTLKSVFEQSATLDEVGGTAYLAQLLSAMVGIMNAAEYGRAIHDSWLRRQLIEIGQNTVHAAYGLDSGDGEAQLSAVTEALMELSSRGQRDAPAVDIGEAARIALRSAEAEARGEASPVLRCGLKPLDDLIGGFREAWFYMLGARPSMGKSTLALQASLGVARRLRDEELNAAPFTAAGGVVLFFSLEMPADQVGGWACCHLAQVSNDVLDGRLMTTQEASAFLIAQRELDGLPIKIIDAVGLSGPSIALRARAENMRRRVRMVVIDHVQKVVSSQITDKRFDPTQETARTTSALKDLSRQIGCPVLALAQLRAEVDHRDNPRPRLADLMYAGGADADVAFFLYRAERYLPRQRPDKFVKETEEQWSKRCDDWHRKWDEARNRAEIICEKRRSGPLGQVTVGFSGPTVSFYALGGDPAEPPPGLFV